MLTQFGARSDAAQFRIVLDDLGLVTSRIEHTVQRDHREIQSQIRRINQSMEAILPVTAEIQRYIDEARERHLEQTSKPAPSTPSSSSATSIATSSSTVQFQTTLTQESRCPPACTCQCHKVATFRYPAWTRHLIGSLFIGYSGVPLLNTRKCNEKSCRGGKRFLVKLSYFFPSWLVARMVFAIGSSFNLLHAVDPFIRVPRVVASSSEIFILAQKGNILEMQKLIAGARGSILDINGNEGRSALHVSFRS